MPGDWVDRLTDDARALLETAADWPNDWAVWPAAWMTTGSQSPVPGQTVVLHWLGSSAVFRFDGSEWKLDGVVGGEPPSWVSNDAHYVTHEEAREQMDEFDRIIEEAARG